MPRFCPNFQWCSTSHLDLCFVGTKIRLLHARPHQSMLRISPRLLLPPPKGVQQGRRSLSSCPRKAREHHGPADNYILLRLYLITNSHRQHYFGCQLILPLFDKERHVETPASIQQRQMAFKRGL